MTVVWVASKALLDLNKGKTQCKGSKIYSDVIVIVALYMYIYVIGGMCGDPVFYL